MVVSEQPDLKRLLGGSFASSRYDDTKFLSAAEEPDAFTPKAINSRVSSLSLLLLFVCQFPF